LRRLLEDNEVQKEAASFCTEKLECTPLGQLKIEKVNIWKEIQEKREKERFIKQRKIFIITCRHFSKLKLKRKK
jgi:hypothetical protein